jgi:hypothetical protein
LTAETVIGALEDAEDYRAFEATIIADYDAQISCEMRTRVAIGRLLWRLRCATTIETGLYDIQADHLNELGHRNPVQPASRQSIYALFERRTLSSADEVFTSAELPNTPLTLRVAFYGYPISPITRSIVSADMKRPCGARSAKRSLHSTPWIAANHKNQGRLLGIGNQQESQAFDIPRTTGHGRGLGRSAMNSRANDIRELCVGEPRCSG